MKKTVLIFAWLIVIFEIGTQNVFAATDASLGIISWSLAALVDDEGNTDTAAVYVLKEIVVSATRSEKDPADIGRSITLIPKEQINNGIYNSVSELLSQQEGIYIIGTGQNPGMLQSMFMRGAASNQTAVLVDEVRITDPSTPTNALDLSELSFAGVDRVELVRGSQSTLYGSSAMGGVINVFTEKNGTPGFNSNVEFSGGSFGSGTSTFSQNVLLNFSHPSGFYANTGIDNSDVKGLDATVDTVTNPNVFKHRDKDGFKKTDLIEKAGFKNEQFDVYASYKNTYQKADLDKGAYTDANNYTLDFRRNLITYGASDKISPFWTVKFLGGYSDLQRVSVEDSSVVDRLGNTDHTYSDGTWKGSMMTNELQVNLNVNGLDAVVGGGLSRETMTLKTFYYSGSFGVYESSSDLDTLNPNSSTKSLFAHIDVYGSSISDAMQRFSLALGARLNDHSTYGTNTTYEINPSFRIYERGLAYASYSSGFNAPALYELFAPDKNYISGIARGNKSLKPETSLSYEAGFKGSIANSFFSIDFFHSIVDNLIEDVYLWDKSIGIDTLGNDFARDDFRGDTYLNVGKQTTNGVEFVLSSKLNHDFSVFGNVSFIAGTLEYDPSAINTAQTGGTHVQLYSNGAFVTGKLESSGLPRRPSTINAGITYAPVERLELRVNIRYAGSRNDVFYDEKLGPYGALGSTSVNDYTLVDFSQRFLFNEHFVVLGRIENIFNTKYSEINGFTTRGRGAFLSLKYNGQPF